MKKAALSGQELVGRWEERREIKNLMGRYAVSFLLKRESTMFDTYWSNRSNVSMDQQRLVCRPGGHCRLVFCHRSKYCIEGKTLKRRSPGPAWKSEDDKTLYGIGDLDVKPLGNSGHRIGRRFENCKRHLVLSRVPRPMSPRPVLYLTGLSACLRMSDFIYENRRLEILASPIPGRH